MTQTMTKPKKVKQAKIELEDSAPKLRFKITNTRAQHFPGPLAETDIFKFKVGELVSNSYNSTVIYEIVEISRDILHSTEISNWQSRLYRLERQADGTISRSYSKDTTVTDLLEKYKQSSNFGVCRIKLKTVLRGANISQKASYKYVKELDIVKAVNYNGLVRVDLDDMLRRRQGTVAKADTQIYRLTARRSNALKQMNAIEAVKNKYFPPVAQPIELLGESMKPIGELKPEMLL